MEQSIAKAKALSNPLRIKILKLLTQRPFTLSEVSRELRISKTNVKAHLKKLLDADLIEENPRSKWKYYALSQGILEKGVVLLSIPLVSFLLAIVAMFSAFQNTVPVVSSDHEYSIFLSFSSLGWTYAVVSFIFALLFVASIIWIVLKRR